MILGQSFFSKMKYLDYRIFYCYSIVCRSVSSVGQHQANKWFITRGFFFKKTIVCLYSSEIFISSIRYGLESFKTFFYDSDSKI